MDARSGYGRVMPVHNLRDYFRSSIDEVIAQQGVSLDPHAAHYVVNLLTTFSRSDQLYEDNGECYGIRPLALMLADAASAEDVETRSSILQRIGDVALFVSGFFSNSLATKAVDVDYYIHMGGNAYGSLSEEVRGSPRGRTFASIYRELAMKFQVLVDVLNEVSEGAREASEIDLLRTYEVWRKTGSKRAKRILKANGVVPIAGAGMRKH
jgi:hypothetical protein